MNDLIKGMAKITAYTEREEALKLWNFLHENKLSELAENYFDSETAEVYFNPNSGFVFLSDEDYNTIMVNDEELDLFINTPHNGNEGFFDEIMEEWEELHQEDKEYIFSIATDNQKEEFKKQFEGFK